TPTLNLTANPSSIIKGQFSTLSWSSTYTTSRTWTGGMSGSEPPSGSKGVNPSATITYSMSATGPGGSVSRSITVTVSIPISDQPPIPNQSPSAANLKVVQPDYCVSGPAGIFSWTFTDPDSGDTQSAYQVQIDKNSNFNSPEDDSGKVTSSSNSYATILGKLKYKTTYYWRVKVWDNKNAESVWVSGPIFTTPEHAYPSIDFKWSPLAPGVNEDVLFSDQSTAYGGASKTSWSWTFQNGSPATSSQQNPTVKFFSIGEKLITLRVTDSDGFSCSRSKTLNAEFPLPKWKEIAPF
ncbi:MAG: PKD domain-containing protein, partial [bacterium]|nr:PKD domain-containing protein [bacterium]